MRVRADDFVARAALDDEDLTRSDPPLVVVDLSGSVPDAVEVGALPAVLVGLGDATGSLARSLDLVTDDERVVAAIERSVTHHAPRRRGPRPAVAGTRRTLGGGSAGGRVDDLLAAPGRAGVRRLAHGTTQRAGARRSRSRRCWCRSTAPTLHVTLNRPHRHNAYSVTMRDGLVDALRLAAADPDLHVLLDGAGPSFSSGGDLGEFGEFGDPATAHAVRLTRSAARLLIELSARVEVHVHGACIGAGVELPAFAARVVAHPDTTFTLPELAFGLVPGAGGTASLPPRIGRQRTAQLALTAEPIDATTALAWGLVDRLSG